MPAAALTASQIDVEILRRWCRADRIHVSSCDSTCGMAIRGPREILTYRGEGVPIINLINAIQECVCESARHTDRIRSLVIFNTTERCTSSPPQPLRSAPWLQYIHTHLRAAIRLPGAAQTSGGAGGCLAHIVTSPPTPRSRWRAHDHPLAPLFARAL